MKKKFWTAFPSAILPIPQDLQVPSTEDPAFRSWTRKLDREVYDKFCQKMHICAHLYKNMILFFGLFSKTPYIKKDRQVVHETKTYLVLRMSQQQKISGGRIVEAVVSKWC